MVTNSYGIFCEEMIRGLLPEIGIPHKFSANGSRESYWWASQFEDHTLGIDCWLTLRDYGEVPVDFTVISDRNERLLQTKISQALSRGVIPVVLEQGMLWRAKNGSHKALEELEEEIHLQVACKFGLLNGNRMTRERAARIKSERRQLAGARR